MALPERLLWPAEAIWQAVAPQLPGFTVEVLPELDSTNAELMRRARAGQTDPVLLVTERQTAGRGRLGRPWHSDERAQDGSLPPLDDNPSMAAAPGGPACLTLSLGLPMAPKDWSGLSLAVGLSLAESLHPDIRLKWPNDLWWRGCKLAGSLIETANCAALQAPGSRYVVIGIGLNIRRPGAQGLATPPAALTELRPELNAAQALACIAAPLVAALQAFEQHGFAPLQSRFNARDALAWQAVSLSDGRSGIAQGVDTDGALRLQTAEGVQRVTSAEVSVRPAPDALPL